MNADERVARGACRTSFRRKPESIFSRASGPPPSFRRKPESVFCCLQPLFTTGSSALVPKHRSGGQAPALRRNRTASTIPAQADRHRHFGESRNLSSVACNHSSPPGLQPSCQSTGAGDKPPRYGGTGQHPPFPRKLTAIVIPAEADCMRQSRATMESGQHPSLPRNTYPVRD